MASKFYQWHADDWELYCALFDVGVPNAGMFVAFSNGCMHPEFDTVMSVRLDPVHRVVYVEDVYVDFVNYFYYKQRIFRGRGNLEVYRSPGFRLGRWRIRDLLCNLLGREWKLSRRTCAWHVDGILRKSQSTVELAQLPLPRDIREQVASHLAPRWIESAGTQLPSPRADDVQRLKDIVFDAPTDIPWNTVVDFAQGFRDGTSLPPL
jgi:hypothetical protein